MSRSNGGAEAWRSVMEGPGLAGVLDALAEAVTIRDADDHIVFANRAALDHMGFETLAQMQSTPPRSIMGDYAVHDEHGRELNMQDVPSVRLLAGEEPTPLVMRTIHRETGLVHWNLLKASGLHDADGRLVAAVTIIEDITADKTAELQERFLARATETLMSSLDYEQTLRNVAALAVPELADWCAVDLVDEHGRRQQVAVAHQDPEKVALAERLRAFEPAEPNPDQGVGRVLATGESELYREIPEEALIESARSPEHLALLQEINMRSALLVPLRNRERSFGVMTLVTSDSPRRLQQSDLEFAETLATRAAVAVDNARLATARRDIASTLQRSLLPEVVPAIPGWEVATLYRAASTTEAVEVGGDFYDFVETDDGWIVILGDVTGKGVEAAAMTSLVRHGAHFLAREDPSPSSILCNLNDALCEQRGMWLCTALCLRLERERVVVSTAGHEPPLVVDAEGEVSELATAGPLLGAWPDCSYVDEVRTVSPREMLLLYTDGVTDTRSQTERFGMDRLYAALCERAGSGPAEHLRALEARLDEFQHRQQVDDTAAVALRPVA